MPYDAESYELQQVYAAPVFHGSPRFDFVELRRRTGLSALQQAQLRPFRFARLALLFKYYPSAADKARGAGRMMALVRWLRPDPTPPRDALKAHGARRLL